jgi:integrase
MTVKAADSRTLERTKQPGIYRRHARGCERAGRCRCPYVVRWKQRGQSRKQLFPTFELAREFKGKLDSGTSRAPLSSTPVADYFTTWIDSYTGRTSRGLEDTSRGEYRRSFTLHVLPLALAQMRMREVRAPDVRDWLRELEGRRVPPATIRKAKAALSVMFATAVEDGDLGSNPVSDVRYVPSAEARRRHPLRKRRELTAGNVVVILNAMPERWRAFFTMLAQTGVRIGELLGLTWRHVHLGDDPHIMIAEQIYRGRRKQLKTEASMARVPLAPTMAAWLTSLRPDDAHPDSPVFESARGTPLGYSNVYNRVLRPALRQAGIAVKVGEDEQGREVWDYQGVAFHQFRKACGSLLLAQGKTLKQVQGWLRHSQLSTTLNVYIHEVDDGLGSADAWDGMIEAAWGHPGATGHPGTPADAIAPRAAESALQSQIGDQPRAAARSAADS